MDRLEKYLNIWGIPIFALWALILAAIAFTNLLLLSRVAELYGYESDLQGRVWLIFILNVLFGLGFGASAYGLWKRRSWGRTLFLWLIVVWSVSNITALFSPDSSLAPNMRVSFSSRIFETIRFTVGPVISLAYFNLDRVKRVFNSADNSANLIVEEVNEK